MPAERTTMRHVREVLRLKFVGGVPTREIARRIGVAASTARTTIRRFQAAGLSWPLPDELIDAALSSKATPTMRRSSDPSRWPLRNGPLGPSQNRGAPPTTQARRSRFGSWQMKGPGRG